MICVRWDRKQFFLFSTYRDDVRRSYRTKSRSGNNKKISSPGQHCKVSSSTKFIIKPPGSGNSKQQRFPCHKDSILTIMKANNLRKQAICADKDMKAKRFHFSIFHLLICELVSALRPFAEMRNRIESHCLNRMLDRWSFVWGRSGWKKRKTFPANFSFGFNVAINIGQQSSLWVDSFDRDGFNLPIRSVWLARSEMFSKFLISSS